MFFKPPVFFPTNITPFDGSFIHKSLFKFSMFYSIFEFAFEDWSIRVNDSSLLVKLAVNELSFLNGSVSRNADSKDSVPRFIFINSLKEYRLLSDFGANNWKGILKVTHLHESWESSDSVLAFVHEGLAFSFVARRNCKFGTIFVNPKTGCKAFPK